MSEREIKLNGGVIIIGSLLWQNDLNNKGDNVRKNWRKNSLDLQKKVLAKFPIRYGRYSKCGIYTMVFSANCERRNTLGTGYIIPLKRNSINNLDIIISEARKVSRAEGMNGKFVDGKKTLWSSMVIKINNEKLTKSIKKEILQKWEENFQIDGGGRDTHDYKTRNEKRSISTKGELQIKWPKAVYSPDNKKINELDFLFATSTKPKHKNSTLKKYPTVSEIAESVMNDKIRYYFLNNFIRNIVTFQDVRIINKLNSML